MNPSKDDLKFPLTIELKPKNLGTNCRQNPPSRIPIWTGRKPKQASGPNDCLKTQFKSTPILERNVKTSKLNSLSEKKSDSTSALEQYKISTIESVLNSRLKSEDKCERKPLKPAKLKRQACPKSKPCPHKPLKTDTKKSIYLSSNRINYCPSSGSEETHDGDSYYFKSEIASGLLPNSIKVSPLSVTFISTPSLQPQRNRFSSRSTPHHLPQKKPKPYLKPQTLLGRSCLTQKQYMDLLATPTSTSCRCKPERKKQKCQPCPPRITKMALPTKRQVVSNWQAYEHVLPAEKLHYFYSLLTSGSCDLEPTDASLYFQKQKKKDRVKPKTRCQCDALYLTWLENEIDGFVERIVELFRKEPVVALNLTEMVMADEILVWLQERRVIKTMHRTTQNVFEKTVVEICDKVVYWVDQLNCVIDLQPVSSKEAIQSLGDLSLDSVSSESEIENHEGEKFKGLTPILEDEEFMDLFVRAYGEDESSKVETPDYPAPHSITDDTDGRSSYTDALETLE